MPKIVIVILAVCVLSVAGAVVIMQQMEVGFFAKEKPMTPEERVKSLRRYISMEPLSISIFRGGAVATTIELKVQLETQAGNDLIIKKQLPRLKDALIRDLHSYFPRLLQKNKELDMADLTRRMFLICQRTLGKGLIKDLLIQSASNRKLQ